MRRDCRSGAGWAAAECVQSGPRCAPRRPRCPWRRSPTTPYGVRVGTGVRVPASKPAEEATMPKRTGIAALVLITTELAGCGRPVPVGAQPDDSARIHQQAVDALA